MDLLCSCSCKLVPHIGSDLEVTQRRPLTFQHATKPTKVQSEVQDIYHHSKHSPELVSKTQKVWCVGTLGVEEGGRRRDDM